MQSALSETLAKVRAHVEAGGSDGATFWPECFRTLFVDHFDDAHDDLIFYVRAAATEPEYVDQSDSCLLYTSDAADD